MGFFEESDTPSSKALQVILAFCLILLLFPGCAKSEHISMTERENDTLDVETWDNTVVAPGLNSWDLAITNSWDEIDAMTDPIHSAILFENLAEGYPEIEVVVIDYQTDGQYFEGEKVYQLVGDKFDLNKLVGDVAIGTTVVVICVVISGATAGTGTPVAVFFAAAAEKSIEAAKVGALVGGAIGSIKNYIDSGGDWNDTLYGALEGSADGYKWGAVFGAVEGGSKAVIKEFLGAEVRFFEPGTPQAKKYPEGIRFTNNYPRFEKYAEKIVRFDFPTAEGVAKGTCLSGQYYQDAKLANKLAGLAKTPAGYVWHHVEDMRTMILIPQEIHSIVFGGMAHKGGASLIRQTLKAAAEAAV